MSALPLGKSDKCEYLTGKEILPSHQSRIIEQTKFTYSPLGKTFQKQIKTTEETEGTSVSDFDDSYLKILTPEEIIQRLPIVLAKVKAENTSKSLLDFIHQIIYSLYRAKEITKKVYNNIMNSIKL